MAFTGPGQNDSGGQAQPALEPISIVWANAVSPANVFSFFNPRGPTNSGVLYQAGGSVFTGGYGQIFPTGRS
jgi:hypothetical protein